MNSVIIVSPNSKSLYQGLASRWAAIEPNMYALLLAGGVRAKGFHPIYLDLEAYPPIDEKDLISKFEQYNCPLIVFSAQGQNPNFSSMVFKSCVETATTLKNYHPEWKIYVTGPHVNAVPQSVLERHKCFDGLIFNEGVYSLCNLLRNNGNPEGIKGIWWSKNGRIETNPPEGLVPQELFTQDMPGPALDLIEDFSKYRTSDWHANFIAEDRSPFSSCITSLGCPFTCSFCQINIQNRDSNELNRSAKDFNTFRFWDANQSIKQFEYLASRGVRIIKITDEMFLLKERHYMPLIDLLIERKLGQSYWAYARIDSVKPKVLEKLKKAGVDWLALGIEGGSESVRKNVTKGKFDNDDIYSIVKMIEDAGISTGLNYIVGLPGDTWETMTQTLCMGLELNGYNHNIYANTKLPGSPEYLEYTMDGGELPEDYSEFAFLGYNHIPAHTNTLSSAEILSFRDYAWHALFENPAYHAKIRAKFGEAAVSTVKEMCKVKLKRKILGD
ncbi:MAG: B12-binding domain-containing radical SAM protein [Nitrososphaerales archaeon]